MFTVAFAVIGAVVDRQSRVRGAAIGAGAGLLADTATGFAALSLISDDARNAVAGRLNLNDNPVRKLDPFATGV